jgi:hypothetical protein
MTLEASIFSSGVPTVFSTAAFEMRSKSGIDYNRFQVPITAGADKTLTARTVSCPTLTTAATTSSTRNAAAGGHGGQAKNAVVGVLGFLGAGLAMNA